MVISGKDNPKIKLYKKLSASKKTRDEMGLFVAEGMRICVDLVRSAEKGLAEITAVFYTENSIERFRDYLPVDCIEGFDSSKSFVITEEIAEKMSDVGNSQGVFIIAKKLDKVLDLQAVNPVGKYLILNGLQDPGNVGTLLRTCDAVGVDGVVLSSNGADLYNPKVVRSAMGSMPRLKIFVENDFEKVIKLFRENGVKTCAAVVKGGTSLSEFDFSGGCAVVIGNEGRGLSDRDIALCDDKITISMKGNLDSLNAAVAGTIFLWEMCKQ